MEPSTCKVTCPDTDSGYIIINQSDYNPEKHELYGVEKKDGDGADENDGKGKNRGSKKKDGDGK